MLIVTTKHFEGQLVTQGGTFADIHAEADKFARAAITVENATGLECWTPQQRKWWKGILLPQLSHDTGDSMGHWEDLLKLGVMPDQFAWMNKKTENGEFEHLPSILILNRKEMREMIEGSVAYLRDEKRYGTKFHWVTLPDEDLRS
jgi:hypothetical protein